MDHSMNIDVKTYGGMMTTLRSTLSLLVAIAGSIVILANSPVHAQRLHRGNWNTLEAISCAKYIEEKYNRRDRDRRDASMDSERVVQITFYGVAHVPHLFGGHKHVSLAVEEAVIEGDVLVEIHKIRSAAYCVLDDNNRVIGLEAGMR
jgi:hypothetical protein